MGALRLGVDVEVRLGLVSSCGKGHPRGGLIYVAAAAAAVLHGSGGTAAAARNLQLRGDHASLAWAASCCVTNILRY